MKPSIRPIFETIYLVILRSGNPSRMLFTERILITCCGLLSIGGIIFDYDNWPGNYLLISAVVFDIGLQHIFSKSLHGEITVMPIGITLLSLNLALYFFEKRDAKAIIRKSKKYAIVICGFLGNTLLGTLGTEIAGLRAIFLPAITFIQFSLKELTRKAGYRTT